MRELSRRSLLMVGSLAIAAAASGCRSGGGGARPHSSAGDCFTAADRRRLHGLRVFQQAFPPASDTDARYAYWPCTDVATSQDLSRSTWTGGDVWALVWANRCNAGDAWNDKPNPLPAPPEHVGALECRAVFSTHAKANAATRCQIRYLLGMAPDDYRAPWLEIPGTSPSDFVADADYRRHPGAFCRTTLRRRPAGAENGTVEETYRVMEDRVVLPAARLTDGENAAHRAGVVLDYEVQDSRPPETTEAFIHQVAYDVGAAGKELLLLTDPFDAPTQQYTGCTRENLPRLLAVVDYLAVFLWAGDPGGSLPASYDRQLQMLGPLAREDYEKLVVNFELGAPGTTLDDARWLHHTLRGAGPHPDKVMFWRDHAVQGGSCDTSTNQKISMVCFGE